MKTDLTNIRYKSDGIARWLDGYRDKWEDFYPSEKWAFDKLAGPEKRLGQILDVGCAMGGLGLALSNRFQVDGYTGVDINRPAIDRAVAQQNKFRIPVRFICNDILQVNDLPREEFDVVVSLSCADWNIATLAIIGHCWEYVRPGGVFVMSVRFTDGQGVNDISVSHQTIAEDENGQAVESANYVVFNWQEFLRLTGRLLPRPSRISGYGYWGKPSANAVTLYERLVFGVMIIEKPVVPSSCDIVLELNLPLTLIAQDGN